MDDSTLLRNSSLFIAYMGCLGWGSAYFYGWGTSFYYGFPWWVVGAGVDDVARSLFYAVTVIVIFLTGWGVGIVFFLGIKQKNNIQNLSFIRLFLAILLLFIPPVLEFSVIHQYVEPDVLIFCVIAVFIITLFVRSGRKLISVKCFSEVSFIRHHRIEFMMAGFMIYFWTFSLIAGCTNPSLRGNISRSTMIMSGITFLHAMMIVLCYQNRTEVGVRNSLYLIADILMILKLTLSGCVKIT